MLPTRSPLVRLCRNASLVRSPIGKKASPADGRTQSQKAAKSDAGAREGSKAAKVLDLLKRSGGVTLKELIKATGWQPHSVRSTPPKMRTANGATRLRADSRPFARRLAVSSLGGFFGFLSNWALRVTST
jgi:hypothetical protein